MNKTLTPCQSAQHTQLSTTHIHTRTKIILFLHVHLNLNYDAFFKFLETNYYI